MAHSQVRSLTRKAQAMTARLIPKQPVEQTPKAERNDCLLPDEDVEMMEIEQDSRESSGVEQIRTALMGAVDKLEQLNGGPDHQNVFDRNPQERLKEETAILDQCQLSMDLPVSFVQRINIP